MASGAENRIILEGKTIGRLSVLRPVREVGKGIKYACVCTCGTKVTVGGQSLRLGTTQSCGCLKRERLLAANLRHGKSKTRIHNIWSSMLQRCNDDNCAAYPGYGGRGIKVSEEWHVFEIFYRDMGEPPKGLTLERKKNDGNYSKDNCEWASRCKQANNRRSNRMITFDGRMQSLASWAHEAGLKPKILWQRLHRGWSMAQALA